MQSAAPFEEMGRADVRARFLQSGGGRIVRAEVRRRATEGPADCRVSTAAPPRRGHGRSSAAARTVDRVTAHLSALVIAEKVDESVDPATYYQDQARKRWAFLSR